MIEIQNLSWRLGTRAILDEVSATFSQGEFWAILGPNGAGKSSLLRFVAGLGRPTVGRVTLDGTAILDWEPKKLARRRALLAQKPVQSLDFLVREVLEMGRYPHFGTPNVSENKQAISKAIEETGIETFLDRHWMSLSGGEQQRVEMARLLAQVFDSSGVGDKVLLLDEPLNNLDLQHQLGILRLARKFSRDGGLVVGIFHDPNMALQFCSHAMILKRGQCQATGEVGDILQPSNLESVFEVPMELQSDSGGGRHLLPRFGA